MTYLESQHIQKLYLFLVEVQQPDPNLTGGHVLSKKALITAVAYGHKFGHHLPTGHLGLCDWALPACDFSLGLFFLLFCFLISGQVWTETKRFWQWTDNINRQMENRLSVTVLIPYLHHQEVHFLASDLCIRFCADEGVPAHRWSELYRNMLSSHQNQDFFHRRCTCETCKKGNNIDFFFLQTYLSRWGEWILHPC